MKKSCYLMISVIALSFPILSGCNNPNGENVGSNNYADKIIVSQLGEGSIQDIANYSAIGVGSLQKVKKNRLFIDKDDGKAEEEAEPDYSPYDYTLLGLTTDGVVEELTLLTKEGNSVRSSNLNITYFNEIGDFVIISYLPISLQDYHDGLLRSDHHWDDDGFNEWIIKPIKSLSYPLIYAFKDAKGEFLDTTYLIHKKSGKMFPFSTHRCYIDLKSHIGPFSEGWIFDEEETNVTVGDELFHEDIYQDCFNYQKYGTGDKWTRYSLNKENRRVFTFDDGFYFPSDDTYETQPKIKSYAGETFRNKLVKFDQDSNSLVVKSDFNFSFDEECDRFGNAAILDRVTSSRYFYNVFTEKIIKKPSDVWDIGYDYFTRQFFYETERSNGSEESSRYIRFFNKDFETDYEIPKDDGLSSYNEFLLSPRWYDEQGFIDYNNGVFWSYDGIYQISLDENGHYYPGSYTLIAKTKVNLKSVVAAYGNYYYIEKIDEDTAGRIHKIEAKNNYLDSVIANIEYRITSIYNDEYGNLRFEGLDESTLNTVGGCVTPNDEVTFEVGDYLGTQTITFSPIN